MQFLHSTRKFQSTITAQIVDDGPANAHSDLLTSDPVKIVLSDLERLKEYLDAGDLLSACRHFGTLTSRVLENKGDIASGGLLGKYLPPDVVLQPVLSQMLEGILTDDGRDLNLPTPLEFLNQMGDIGALRTMHYAVVLLSMVRGGANTTSLIPVFDSAILFNSENLKEVMSNVDEFLSLDYDVATPHFIAFLILRHKGVSSDQLSRLESVLAYSPYPIYRQVERILDYHGFSINLTTHILAQLQAFSAETIYTNTHALTQLINAVLTSSVDLKTLVALYQSIKTKSPKKLGAPIYNLFIATLLSLPEGGAPLATQSAAFSVWNDMEADGIIPGVIEWTNLMKSFSGSRDKSVILPLWRKMIQNGIFPDDRAWTVRIHALLGSNMVKEGLESLREMQNSSVKPNISTINAVLSGLLKFDHILEASQVLEVAGRLGIRKDLTTYNTLLVSLMKQQRGNSKKFDESLALIRQMSADGISPDIQTITLILDGMYKFSDPKPTLSAVLSLLNYCESAGITINIWTFTALIRALLEGDREDAAIDMLLVMESRGMTGTSATYNTLLKYYFNKRDMRSVDELLEEMVHKCVVMDRRLWQEIIVGFAGAGQVDRMKRAITQMHKGPMGMGILGYMSTLKRLGTKGLLADAKEVVEGLLDRRMVGRTREVRMVGPEKGFWEVVEMLGGGAVMTELIYTKRVDP